jgi:hypothetical protein
MFFNFSLPFIATLTGWIQTAAPTAKYVFDAGLARVDRPADKRSEVEAGFSRARRER